MHITFDFVPLHEVAHEIAPNVSRHHSEMTEGDDYGPPEIDWDAYLAASHAGQCLVVTARDDGKLVGYSVFTIGANPRYKRLIEAQSSGLFIEKEYRKWSREFLRRSDEYLKNLGVKEASYTLSDDRVGKLLGRNQYQQKYKVYTRRY